MSSGDLRAAYYQIRRQHDQLARDHAVLFDGCAWQTIGNTEQRIGCDGYRLIVGQTEHGIEAQILDPTGKAIASYR